MRHVRGISEAVKALPEVYPGILGPVGRPIADNIAIERLIRQIVLRQRKNKPKPPIVLADRGSYRDRGGVNRHNGRWIVASRAWLWVRLPLNMAPRYGPIGNQGTGGVYQQVKIGI